MEKRQINLYVSESFLSLIDDATDLTDSTRSDFIRNAMLHYLLELKRKSMLRSLKEGIIKFGEERERATTEPEGLK